MIQRIYDKTTGRFIRDDFNFNGTKENAYIGDIPSGFYWPKYDGTKWIEALTQAEIDAIKANAQPIMPTLEERVTDVEAEYATLFTSGKNKFNGIYLGGYGVGATNDLIKAASNSFAAIVEIENDKTYTVTKFIGGNRFRIALIDVYPEHELLPITPLYVYRGEDSSSQQSRTFVNSVNAKYAVICVTANNAETPLLQLEEGLSTTEYEEYIEIIKEDKLPLKLNDINNLVDRVEGLVGQLVGGYIKDWGTGQVHVQTGVDYPNTRRARTQFIEVKKGDIVKCLDTDELLGVSIFKYSLVDQTFIKQITSYTYEQAIDEDCYIRLVTRYIDERVIGADFKILEDKFLIVKSAPITPAENKPFLFGDFKKLYHTLPCDDVSSTAPFKLHTSTINDIYAEYDNLVTNNPHSMSKNLLGYGSDLDGLEDNSLPIYEYTIFNPQNGNRALQNNSPTILLLTGIHGDEKSSVWSALQFFKQLMTNWINDDSLASIKGNVTFKIIPILNPYGFNNNTRNNARNVNLNRNLSYKWSESTDTDKGSSPYSELESLIIKDWLYINKGANIFIDFHNTGESIDPPYLSTPNQTLKFIFGSVMRRLTDIWKSKYVLSMDNISYGWTTTNSIPGTANEGFYVNRIERSAVLEIAWDFQGKKYTKEVIERGVYLLANYILSMLADYSS